MIKTLEILFNKQTRKNLTKFNIYISMTFHLELRIVENILKIILFDKKKP